MSNPLGLRNSSLLETRALIGGEWTGASKRFAVRNPANGAVVAEVADVGVAGARAPLARGIYAALTPQLHELRRDGLDLETTGDGGLYSESAPVLEGSACRRG